MQRLEQWWRKRRSKDQEEQEKTQHLPIGSGGRIEIYTDFLCRDGKKLKRC
jgi:hypothetical protein